MNEPSAGSLFILCEKNELLAKRKKKRITPSLHGSRFLTKYGDIEENRARRVGFLIQPSAGYVAFAVGSLVIFTAIAG